MNELVNLHNEVKVRFRDEQEQLNRGKWLRFKNRFIKKIEINLKTEVNVARNNVSRVHNAVSEFITIDYTDKTANPNYTEMSMRHVISLKSSDFIRGRGAVFYYNNYPKSIIDEKEIIRDGENIIDHHFIKINAKGVEIFRVTVLPTELGISIEYEHDIKKSIFIPFHRIIDITITELESKYSKRNKN